MNNRLIPLPAIVRPSEDLESLAVAINAEHEAVEMTGRQTLEHAREAGEKLIQAKKLCGHGKWLKWVEKTLPFSDQTARNYMRVAAHWEEIKTALNLQEALRWLTDDPIEEDAVPEFVTLAEWNEASAKIRKQLLAAEGKATFNEEGDRKGIEWALWSWNPVTGCKHDCPYCYARDMANRFYEPKFEPALWPGRLTAPQNTALPTEKIEKAAKSSDPSEIGLGNVFVCSMADLFGRWVPREWIDAVLGSVRSAPQWNFLFLTKFPVRMAEFDFPDNAWVGTTVDCQARVANAERSFRKVKAAVKWLSCEPLIEPLKFSDLGAFDWVVLGGASSSSKTPEWHPPRSWVHAIEAEALRLGVRIYEKVNLFDRVRQYPGIEVSPMPNAAPKELHYLPTVEPPH